MKAILRRSELRSRDPLLALGDVTVQRDAREVTVAGKSITPFFIVTVWTAGEPIAFFSFGAKLIPFLAAKALSDESVMTNQTVLPWLVPLCSLSVATVSDAFSHALVWKMKWPGPDRVRGV